MLSSCKTTTSPTFKFLEGRCYFANRWRLDKYSEDHLCQNWRTRAWHRCQRRRRERVRYENEGSGRASMGLPMRKWPGVSASIPSSSEGRETRGRLLRHASTWVSTVVNSSNVSFTLATIRFRWVFKLFTAASQRPPKCGACSGMNFHCMPWVEQNSEMVVCALWVSRNSTNSRISLAAPTKLVPWSFHIRLGLPRLAIKRLKQAIKASLVRSDTNSKCTALTERDTKTQM